MTFDEWLGMGIDNGWVSEPSCYMHDTPPLTDEEAKDYYEDGNDPCLYILRIWEDE